ncbi:hypothetical protein BDQ17DRAFT_1329941 [Cyathus striatus]|nr:hypothetical protein BDQ17DRAFT_1329941 [Cyathus striatus]
MLFAVDVDVVRIALPHSLHLPDPHAPILLPYVVPTLSLPGLHVSITNLSTRSSLQRSPEFGFENYESQTTVETMVGLGMLEMHNVPLDAGYMGVGSDAAVEGNIRGTKKESVMGERICPALMSFAAMSYMEWVEYAYEGGHRAGAVQVDERIAIRTQEPIEMWRGGYDSRSLRVVQVYPQKPSKLHPPYVRAKNAFSKRIVPQGQRVVAGYSWQSCDSSTTIDAKFSGPRRLYTRFEPRIRLTEMFMTLNQHTFYQVDRTLLPALRTKTSITCKYLYRHHIDTSFTAENLPRRAGGSYKSEAYAFYALSATLMVPIRVALTHEDVTCRSLLRRRILTKHSMLLVLTRVEVGALENYKVSKETASGMVDEFLHGHVLQMGTSSEVPSFSTNSEYITKLASEHEESSVNR